MIDFNEAPATGNEVNNDFGTTIPVSDIGGLYMLQSTKDDEKPVYFYRGNVKDNNVILNDFCWLMVRTTETGGTKLIYNGTPTEDGQCLGDPDWTIESLESAYTSSGLTSVPKTNIGISKFNNKMNSPADLYYMYGERFESQKITFSSGTYFGNDVEYVNRAYTLKDTVTVSNYNESLVASNGHHYSCTTTSTTCSTVHYATYPINSSYGYFITLSNGDTYETALEKMMTNENESTAKRTIERWFSSNMVDAIDLLEDTTWNSQKAFESGTLRSKNVNTKSEYDEYNISKEIIDAYYYGIERDDRNALPLMHELLPEDDDNSEGQNSSIDYNIEYLGYNSHVSLGCPVKKDCYTVDSTDGNGALSYPVGMLTTSEMLLAGNGYPSMVEGTYLDDDSIWWLLTPFMFVGSSGGVGDFFGPYGQAMCANPDKSYGLRPAVSLNNMVVALEGDGSPSSPFANLMVVSDEEETPSSETKEDEEEATPINPQTSDTLIKAACIILATTTSAYIIGRKLSRR
ncbi:hypothetical protein IJJ54_01365 [Candidatus Saccharibacteria bacterium]|nr:hypothetical protein [Candidatus Saccharibacteria bacterium]